MTRRPYRETAPLAMTARLASMLGAECARLEVSIPPDHEAADRLLRTARSFVLCGDQAALPGLGRLIPGGPLPQPEYHPAIIDTWVPPGFSTWARVAPDAALGTGWPHALLRPVDPYTWRWMSFVLPDPLAASALEHLPVRAAAGAGDDLTARRIAEEMPAQVLLAAPEDARDAFQLPWLNDIASRLSHAAGRAHVVGVSGQTRALYLGTFENGRHVSLFREDLHGLFGDFLPPEPRVPSAPRYLVPLLSVVASEAGSLTQLARRVALGETGGCADLDAISGVAYALAPAPEPPADPDDDPAPTAFARNRPGTSGVEDLISAVRLAWGTDAPVDAVWTAVARAFARLSRELAGLAAGEACVDLSPLGVMLRVDETEVRAKLPGGPGRVTLPARSTWVLAL